jgi:hypothetical protein
MSTNHPRLFLPALVVLLVLGGCGGGYGTYGADVAYVEEPYYEEPC